MSYLTTVTGSYPRKEVQKDTLRKPSVSEQESFEETLMEQVDPEEVQKLKDLLPGGKKKTPTVGAGDKEKLLVIPYKIRDKIN